MRTSPRVPEGFSPGSRHATGLAPIQPRLRCFADGPLRALDALAPVQARDHLGALGLGVGQRVALGGLPALAVRGVAEEELEFPRHGLARAVVDALEDALGEADAAEAATSARAAPGSGSWAARRAPARRRACA